MGVWNNNDREESKPQFLNKTEKRHVVRTIRGWEMPLMGSQFAYGVTNGNYGSAVGLTTATVQTELVVCLPNDPSITGVTSSNYAYGFTGQLNGLTFGSDFQDQPYFSAPFNGDSVIAGTPFVGATGVSHAFLTYTPGFDANGYPLSWGAPGATPALSAYPTGGVGYQYGVNAYGVSTLGGLTGVTAYIKIQAHDTNLSQNLTIGLSGTYPGMALYTGVGLTVGSNVSAGQIPFDVYRNFFGPTGDKNGRVSYRQDNIAVLVVGGLAASGNKIVTLNLRDNSGSVAPWPGLTGSTGTSIFTLTFDRFAGLTTAGSTAGSSTQAPTVSQYFYANTSTIRI
jgi:hypothetical protein